MVTDLSGEWRGMDTEPTQVRTSWLRKPLTRIDPARDTIRTGTPDPTPNPDRLPRAGPDLTGPGAAAGSDGMGSRAGFQQMEADHYIGQGAAGTMFAGVQMPVVRLYGVTLVSGRCGACVWAVAPSYRPPHRRVVQRMPESRTGPACRTGTVSSPTCTSFAPTFMSQHPATSCQSTWSRCVGL